MTKAMLPLELSIRRLISSTQASDALGYSRVHFNRLVKAGVLPKPIKISERVWRWRADEIAAVIERASDAREAA